jgi:N-ethylmaleimide reductase
MHSGRVSHLANLPQGAEVIAPSAVPFKSTMWVDGPGLLPCSPPRAMNKTDIDRTVAEYATAAKYALEAGFDGVELHGANGYLIDQFLNPETNRREDGYGGSTDKRNRFALEVANAVVAAIGAGRTGIRLSPHGVFNDMIDFPGIADQYGALATVLGGLNLAYIHLVDHSAMGAPKPAPATVAAIRTRFRAAGDGTLILSGGYDRDRAEADLQSGAADLIAFGRPFISNPDLVERLRRGAELTSHNEDTLYTPGAEGYTDYPTL